MSTLRVHNPSSTSRVVTTDGRMLAAFTTGTVPADDRIALRLIERGRLIDITPTSDETDDDAEGDAELEEPAANASRATWADYAIAQGYSAYEIEGLKRDELRELFAEEDSAEDTPVEGDTSTDEESEATADGAPDSDDNAEEQ